MSDDHGIGKQFATLLEQPPQNGYPAMVDYVDARNPLIVGHTSAFNPPPTQYTYSLVELQPAIELLRKLYPNAHIEAHEVAYINHRAMADRWLAARKAEARP